MLEDALLDLTNRGDIVVDPFLGSGSTLIAADKTGRVCRGLEFDPLYVDVIVRRYEGASGQAAVLAETGESFREVSARREKEAFMRIRPRHSCWPPPSQQVESECPRFGNPALDSSQKQAAPGPSSTPLFANFRVETTPRLWPISGNA